MQPRVEAIADVMQTYGAYAGEFAYSREDAARIEEEGREALRALGVTDAEIAQAEGVG